MTSIPAPDAAKPYRRVLVLVPLDDLQLRRAAEDRFVSAFAGSGATFVPAYTVLFPGRSYAPDEVTRVLRDQQVDARLELAPGESGVTTYQIGEVTTARCTERTARGDCDAAVSRTRPTDRAQPWTTFTARLVDQRTGQSVWVASGKAVGNDYAQWANLIKSMAATTARKLRADGMVQ